MQSDYFLHSTTQPFDLESDSVSESKSANVVKPLWRLMRRDSKDFGLKKGGDWSDRQNEASL